MTPPVNGWEPENADIVQVAVWLVAFQGGCRVVNIPAREWALVGESDSAKLDLVFHWGQNDFQPQRRYSVSVGDLITLATGSWWVRPFGFVPCLTEDVQDAINRAQVPSKSDDSYDGNCQ